VAGSEFFMHVCVHAMALRCNFMFGPASYMVLSLEYKAVVLCTCTNISETASSLLR
jgi:hypothetical protein